MSEAEYDPLDTEAIALAWNKSIDEFPNLVDLTETSERFHVIEEIGQGAMGVVVLADDRDLNRRVAIKKLAPQLVKAPASVHAFIEEARLTGSLDHPNIVPVYELGQDEDGHPYFAMRVLEGRPLGEILRLLRAKDPEAVAQFTRTRLLTHFLQLCGAVEFAHSRGVIHRDLKPDNVIVGDFGDVQVLDWGIAVRVDDVDGPAPEELKLPAGTPGFIAPELIELDRLVLPRRLDVFALGAVLYELLTLKRPARGRTPRELMAATVTGEFKLPSARATERAIPDELDEICMRALDPDPSRRTPSVGRLAKEVEEYLEGAREARRRAEEADRAVDRAARHLVRQREVEAEMAEQRSRVEALRSEVEPWDRVDTKRELWRAEDELQELIEQRAELLAKAEQSYRRALENVQGHEAATEGLLGLWMRRLRAEERSGDPIAARITRSRIRALDPIGANKRLKGDGRLVLTSHPPGARVWLHRFDEKDRLQVAAEGIDLGVTPLREVDVPFGRHLLMLEATNHEAARVPIWLTRDGRIELQVTLRPAGEVPHGMAYVPGGPFLWGSRQGLNQHQNLARAFVADFAIGILPVTFREYGSFLDAVAEKDPSEALKHVPRTRYGVQLMVADDQGRHRTVSGPLVTAGGKPYAPRAALRLPVVGVDWHDAMAYCAWRSEVLGVAITLPTSEQWEKAARGVDGRLYPWGDTWDPGFCNVAGARPTPPQLEPAGAYGMDESVYGMRDARGGVREWCLDALAGTRRVIRGGDWTEDGAQGLGTTSRADPNARSLRTGFRVATGLLRRR